MKKATSPPHLTHEQAIAGTAAQVRQLLAKAHYGSGYPSDVPEQLDPVVDAARMMVADGDGASAIAVLRVVCEPVVENYEEYEGDCEVAEFLEYDVVPLLTEAIELGDINPHERQELAGVLAAWDEQFEEYIGITPFEKPRQALRAGQSPQDS